MNAFLAHIDTGPMVYGVLFFLSFVLILIDVLSLNATKLIRASCVALFIYIGFTMHGDAYTGRTAVAVAALLFHISFTPIIWIARR